MREIDIHTKIKVYDSIQELDEKYAQLIKASQEAIDIAYAPYSHFLVGAAILGVDGSISKGANQENAAFPVSICAEGIALGNFISNHPNTAIQAIAISVKSQKPNKDAVAPCGFCRQNLAEYENRLGHPIVILLAAADGRIYQINRAEDLLPLSFKPDNLI